MISVIVPTRNEEGNIANLVSRIDAVMKADELEYETIIIDDHSDDNTMTEIRRLENSFPIRGYLKKGQRGKAFSIIEGLGYAKGETIAMIDADLQYPPEAIPEMARLIDGGAGVAVARRDESGLNKTRRVASHSFKNIFGKRMHGLDVDIQSGLKVFKKEIAQRATLTPTPWTFDLDFLIQAKDAGYKIEEIEIPFANRGWGESKVNVAKASWEIGKEAVKSKLKLRKTVPLLNEEGFHYLGKKYVHHTSRDPEESALYTLNNWEKAIVASLLGLFVLLLFINWHDTLVVLLAGLTIIYFTDLLFNLFLIIRSLTKDPEIKVTPEELARASGQELPTYTILCPLYKEGEVLPQFVKAMAEMDYPKEKLQILLLLEEDDKETQIKAGQMQLPSYFQIVVVPDSQPKTKPKACNYGLKIATGEFVVIYDAEDMPEPDQLKKAVIAFRRLDPSVVCMQAKLNFYNPHQNLLTKLFTSEYSLWFDLVLTGLQSINAPIPLGGTSNHFKTQGIKELEGWDPFNVTEDCDLGMRLAKKGYKTSIVDSTTWEEANSSLPNWFNQRTRWIKGYIQTYLVHLRSPRQFAKMGGWTNLAAFQLIVGGKIWSMFINPLMWAVSIIYFADRSQVGGFIESFFPSGIFYMAVTSMVVGNFLYLYYYMIGSAKREQNELIKYAFLIPAYWLLMSAAAWTAIYRLIKQPYYWSKTKHGLHIKGQPTAEPTPQTQFLPAPNWDFNKA